MVQIRSAVIALAAVLALVSAVGLVRAHDTKTGGGGSGRVTIADFAFGPDPVKVATGDSVMWTNKDAPTHTVTADKGEFDSKRLDTGKSFSYVFAKAGRFEYHCSIHESMHGTVEVK